MSRERTAFTSPAPSAVAAQSRRTLQMRTQSELERMLDIQEVLGGRLKRELDEMPDEGRPVYVYGAEGATQVGTTHAPDRDWSRAYGHYRSVNASLMTEQRESVKLAILAHKAGESTLTDEEYAEELRLLGEESVRELPDDALAAELERRGLKVETVVEADE